MSVYSARYVWVMVKDLAVARHFYLDMLKLDPIRLSPELEKRYLLCELNPVVLVVAEANSSESDRVGRWTGLSINVQDLEATVNHLSQQGVTITQEPVLQPWGDWQATVDDGCGNELMLTGVRGDGK